MECNSKLCPRFHFCHEASNACRPCSSICDSAVEKKYEASLCKQECQEYMFEQQRVPAAVDGTARVLGGVGLGVGVVALTLLLLVCYCVHRRPKQLLHYLQSKVDVEAPSDVKVKMSANNNKCDIGLDNSSSVCTVSGSVRSLPLGLGPASTLSTLALPQPLGAAPAPPLPPARHPSEDSTLDYAAYDNPALSPSSSPLPPSASASASAGGKAMDAVLDAVLEHATLPGTVSDLHRGLGGLHNGLSNGSVARMESSF